MNCIEIAANLQLFLDDELPSDGMSLIRQHLDQCSECAYKFEAEKLFKDTLRQRISRRSATDNIVNDVKLSVLHSNSR